MCGICSFIATILAGCSISISVANDVEVGRWSVKTLLRPDLAEFVNKSFQVILPWDYFISLVNSSLFINLTSKRGR